MPSNPHGKGSPGAGNPPSRAPLAPPGRAIFLPPGVPNRPGTFALVVDGDCMKPEIRDGDFVLCHRNEPPVVGKPAVVKIQGCVPAVKLWRPARGDVVRLVPTNPVFEPIRCRRAEISWACRVLGVVRRESAEALQAVGSERK